MTKTIQHTHSPILLFIVLFSIQLVFSQKKYTVNNTPGTAADFSDIQKAIDFAKNGDTIYVQHSANEYNNFILNKRLHIRGRSHSLPNYITKIGNINISKGASGSSIMAMNMKSIQINDNGSGNLKNILICNNKIKNINLKDEDNKYTFDNIQIIGNVLEKKEKGSVGSLVFGKNCTNIIMSNNVIRLYLIFDIDSNNLLYMNNIHYFSTPSFKVNNNTLKIQNCIFVTNSDYESEVLFENIESGNVEISNCYTFNYGKGTYTFEKSDKIKLTNSKENIDPIFVKVNLNGESIAGNGEFNALEDDLHLQPNSPAKGAGVFGN